MYHVSTIAEGGFGVVYLTQNNKGKKFALKRLIVPRDDEERNSVVKRERDIMKAVSDHPYIISLVSSQKSPDGSNPNQSAWYFLMEYSPNSVQRVMTSHFESNKSIKEKLILQIFVQTCVAVNYLHTHFTPPIAHRDIKIENILIGEDGRFMMFDFDFIDV